MKQKQTFFKISTEISSEKPEHPAGMILAFSLVVLLLISLMGIAIISNTQTELNISSNTTSGRDTFIRTDSAARMSAFFGHIILATSADPGDVLDDKKEYMKVDISDLNSGLLLETFFADQTGDVNPALRRYLQAGSDETAGNTPHITFREPDPEGRIFATSALAIDNIQRSSDSPDANVFITAVATTIGRNIRGPATTSSFVSQDDAEVNLQDGPYSIISTVFRVVQ